MRRGAGPGEAWIERAGARQPGHERQRNLEAGRGVAREHDLAVGLECEASGGRLRTEIENVESHRPAKLVSTLPLDVSLTTTTRG